MNSNIIYCSCVLCKTITTTQNINKHYDSKTCRNGPFIKSTECKHCKLDFTNLTTSQIANHSRWCDKNPKKKEYLDHFVNNPARLSSVTSKETGEKRAKGIKKAHEDGKYENAPAKRLETKTKNNTFLSKESNPKWYENVCKGNARSMHTRSGKHTHEFTDKRGRTFKFDSSWEDLMAIRLDELDINWIRPQPIEYIIEGRTRRYYGDFYLPDYNLYLDPKNPYVERQQQEKIKILHNMIRLIILRSPKEIKSFTI
jgi:hypothetical protein